MYPTQNVYFLKKHNKKKGQVCLDRKVYQDALIVSFTATPPAITTSTNTGEQISSLSSKIQMGFAKKLRSLFGILHQKFSDVRMKRRALQSKKYCSFWSSAKWRKYFSCINIIIKSDLKKWIISHPHVIQYHIANNYIKMKSNNGNGGLKTELNLQKVLLQVSVCEPYIDMLNKYSTCFSMAYDKILVVCISDSAIWLLLTPKLQNKTQWL